MIPKLIHYCWFGPNPKTELAEKCIASWKKYLSDYELIEWNESNFDVNQHPFTKEAYQEKKYAFVTDYVRLFVLQQYGGIYMDTDVEVIKNLDNFLKHNAFSGFEDRVHIPTGIIASEKNGNWVSEMLKYYDGRGFIKDNGSPDTKTNVEIITEMMSERGFIANNKLQDFPGFITIYPHDFFCPKNYRTEKIKITKNTYTIHHFAKSWKEPESFAEKFIRKHPFIDKLIVNVNQFFVFCFGKRWENFSKKIKSILHLTDN